MKLKDTVWCDGCGVELFWAPVCANERDYCCEDCRDGYVCNCGTRMEDDEYPRAGSAGANETVSDEMSF